MAEPSRVNVIQLLNLDDAEVYETHQGQARLLAKGPLALIYEKKHKWVLLKIADFNYGLSKKIPLLCSLRERGAFRAYVVPSPNGFYVIKIVNVWTISELLKLDEILKENTQFAYKDDFDTYPVHQIPRSNTQLSNEYLPSPSLPDYQRSQSYPATQQDWSHLTNNFYQIKQPQPQDLSRQQQVKEFEDDLSNKMIQLRGETLQSRQGILPKKKSYTMPPQQKPVFEKSYTMPPQKPVIDLSSEPEPTAFQPDDAHRIYAGGKTVRNAMVGSAHVISGGIKKMGGFIKKTFMKRKEGEEPKEMDESTHKQLTLASAAAGTIVQIKAAMVATKIIGGQMSKTYEKKKSKAQTEENKEKLERKGSMTHAAVCTSMNVFSGMGEALGVIFGGVQDMSHDLVTHQHGEKAGSIVRASSGVFGLINLPGKKSQKTTN